MAWFKVDDRLHDHFKARRVRRSHQSKHRDVAPFGLWAMAGSWCGSNPTHGFIPTEILQEWDDHATVLAGRLVDAGLWVEDEVADEPGYRFHDWDDQNPTSSDDSSEYGRRGNHIRHHERKGVISPDCTFCSGATRGDGRGDSGGDSSRPVPTRPDPTPGEEDFDAFWALYPRKAGKGQAAKAWKGAVRKAEPATIIAGLRLQLPSLAMQRKADGDFRPYPGTWLSGERWADDVEDIKPRDTRPEGW